jgi:multidrug resistance efflux pump
MKRLPLIRPLLGLTAGLLLCGAAILLFWRMDRVGVAPGFLTGSSRQVCAPRDGLISAVAVRNGEKVAAGQELARLDPRDLETEAASRLAAIQAMESDLTSRRAEIRRLEMEVQPKEAEEAAAGRDKAKLRLEQAASSADALSRLGEASLASRLQVEQAVTEKKLATIELQDAERALTLQAARHGSRIDALRSEERRLEKEIDGETVRRRAALAAIEASILRAPVDGAVTTDNLDELPGRAFRAGEEVLRVDSGAPDRFEGSLADTDRAVVKPGQTVKIRLEAYPWLLHGSLRGSVLRVSERRPRDGGFPVEISVEPATAPGALQEGMRGTARIVVEENLSLGRLFLEKVSGRVGP